MLKPFLLLVLSLIFLTSCGVTRINPDRNLSFKVLDEYVIPPQTYFNDEEIGGLSGIDYKDGNLLLVDDRSTRPIIYEVEFKTTGNKIDSLVFLSAINLKKTDPETFKPMSMDLESVRYDASDSAYIWVSNEGNINAGKDGGAYQISREGKFISSLKLPDFFLAKNPNPPRNNGVFEAMDFSVDGNTIWMTTELPLVKDGKKPQLWKTYSPLRIVGFDTKRLHPEVAYVYDLDRIVLWPFLPFMINGVTEILSYTDTQFLVLERAFSAGRGKKSNRVKLFLASTENATDVLATQDISQPKKLQLMQKELVLNFKKIRKQLSSRRIDNIEGMCFGPKLANGNRSLLFISDNNFNTFTDQITQLIWLEMIEK